MFRTAEIIIKSFKNIICCELQGVPRQLAFQNRHENTTAPSLAPPNLHQKKPKKNQNQKPAASFEYAESPC